MSSVHKEKSRQELFSYPKYWAECFGTAPFLPMSREEMDQLGLPEDWRKDTNLKMYRPKGCAACDFKGYMGRTGLFEMMLVDETVREMILQRAMSMDLRKVARKTQGMLTLREEGIIKCVQGITSPEEILNHTDRYDD